MAKMSVKNISKINLVEEFVMDVNDIHCTLVSDVEFDKGLKSSKTGDYDLDDKFDDVFRTLKSNVLKAFDLLKTANTYTDLQEQLSQLGVDCFKQYRDVVIHAFNTDNDIAPTRVSYHLNKFRNLFAILNSNDVWHSLNELDEQYGIKESTN